MPYRDEDDDRLHPAEFPEADTDDELIPCPYCRAMIYEASERCAECGEYLSREDEPAGRPWWIVVGLLVCLAMAVSWVVWG